MPSASSTKRYRKSPPAIAHSIYKNLLGRAPTTACQLPSVEQRGHNQARDTWVVKYHAEASGRSFRAALLIRSRESYCRMVPASILHHHREPLHMVIPGCRFMSRSPSRICSTIRTVVKALWLSCLGEVHGRFQSTTAQTSVQPRLLLSGRLPVQTYRSRRCHGAQKILRC